ncbi:Mitochondrial carrier protein ymc2, partial [Cladochytrium tenue]
MPDATAPSGAATTRLSPSTAAAAALAALAAPDAAVAVSDLLLLLPSSRPAAPPPLQGRLLLAASAHDRTALLAGIARSLRGDDAVLAPDRCWAAMLLCRAAARDLAAAAADAAAAAVAGPTAAAVQALADVVPGWCDALLHVLKTSCAEALTEEALLTFRVVLTSATGAPGVKTATLHGTAAKLFAHLAGQSSSAAFIREWSFYARRIPLLARSHARQAAAASRAVLFTSSTAEAETASAPVDDLAAAAACYAAALHSASAEKDATAAEPGSPSVVLMRAVAGMLPAVIGDDASGSALSPRPLALLRFRAACNCVRLFVGARQFPGAAVQPRVVLGVCDSMLQRVQEFKRRAADNDSASVVVTELSSIVVVLMRRLGPQLNGIMAPIWEFYQDASLVSGSHDGGVPTPLIKLANAFLDTFGISSLAFFKGAAVDKVVDSAARRLLATDAPPAGPVETEDLLAHLHCKWLFFLVLLSLDQLLRTGGSHLNADDDRRGGIFSALLAAALQFLQGRASFGPRVACAVVELLGLLARGGATAARGGCNHEWLCAFLRLAPALANSTNQELSTLGRRLLAEDFRPLLTYEATAVTSAVIGSRKRGPDDVDDHAGGAVAFGPLAVATSAKYVAVSSNHLDGTLLRAAAAVGAPRQDPVAALNGSNAATAPTAQPHREQAARPPPDEALIGGHRRDGAEHNMVVPGDGDVQEAMAVDEPPAIPGATEEDKKDDRVMDFSDDAHNRTTTAVGTNVAEATVADAATAAFAVTQPGLDLAGFTSASVAAVEGGEGVAGAVGDDGDDGDELPDINVEDFEDEEEEEDDVEDEGEEADDDGRGGDDGAATTALAMSSSSAPAPAPASKSSQTVKELFAGSVGGIAQVLTGQPFDTVKVRLQTQPGKYASALDCVRQTYQHEGFRGFYKGTLTPLIGI